VNARPGRYQRRLLVLLSSAGFFATYDASVLALLLPNIQSAFGVGEATLGLVRIPIELGLVAALFLARLADRVGRRPLLLWSIMGYTAATVLTAVSWDIWSFAAFQFAARVFVGSELAVAVTMVVEELPTGRRARGLGLLLAVEALGTIAVALLLAAGLQETGLEWRAFFLAGVAPLLVLAVCRRSIRETERFNATPSAAKSARSSLLAPWHHPTRSTLVAVGLVYLLRSVPLYGAVAWWAYFAQRERGFSETDVGLTVLTAYGLGCAGYYVCGRLMERVGRRATALLYLPVAIASTIALFQVRSPVVGFVALFLAVATGLGLQPVLSAFATEPFPTDIRAQAAAWARNGFEIAGLVLGPALVGVLGDHVSGPVGSVGDAASLLALVALPALYVVWRHLPETRGRELVDVSVPSSRPNGDASPWRMRAAAVAAVTVLAGTFALLVAGRSALRPEGRAERWLEAVADTGRPGAQADARARADAIGDLEVAAPLRAWGPDRRGYFASLEVGRSRRAGAEVAVPFGVRRDHHFQSGVVVLRQEGGTWRIVALGPRRPAPEDRVPSEGGPVPGGAAASAWVASAAVTGLVALACALGLWRHTTR